MKTYEDLLSKELIVGGTGGSADTDQFPRVLNGVLDTKMKVIIGYPGGNDVNLAMERGEVQGRCGWSWSSVKSTQQAWLRDKTIVILVQLSMNKHPDLPDVPTFTEAGLADADVESIWGLHAPAGTPADIIARTTGQKLGEVIGQQIIIENVVGAGGTTGAIRAMRAAADGYTLFLGHMGTHGAALAVYPMYKGLAQLVGMNKIEGPQTIAEQCQRYVAEYDNYDFFFIHFKYTDKAGEDGNFQAKVKAIEEFDAALPILLARKPDDAIRRSIRGMLPKGPLGRQMIKKLNV